MLSYLLGGDRGGDGDVKGYGARIRTLGQAGGRAEEECVRPSATVVVDTWRPPERADPLLLSHELYEERGDRREYGVGKSGEGDARERERKRESERERESKPAV